MMRDDGFCSRAVDRRKFLQAGALGMAAIAEGAAGAAQPGVAPPSPYGAAQDAATDLLTPPLGLVDVNVYLSQWPFRRLPGSDLHALVQWLQGRGVTQAWAGNFDALLHRDVANVNLRLIELTEQSNRGRSGHFFLPFGVVNPKLPDWEEDLRRCQEEHGMPGIRLHPNYHGYTLDDPDFARLLDGAAERGMIVQIALTMEDERTQHPLVQVPHVDAQPLAAHARRLPGLSLMLLNAFRSLRPVALGPLGETDNISFDIAMLENVGGVASLAQRVSPRRVLFGSYAPFFPIESALLKLKESALEDGTLEAIAGGNARSFRS